MTTRSLSLLLASPLLALLSCGGDPEPGSSELASDADTGSNSPAATDAPPVERKAIDPANTGTLRGVVLFDGDAPPIRPLEDVPDQPGCHEGHDTPPISEFFVVTDGRVRDVFVSVDAGLEGWILPEAPSETAELSQRGCVYRPHAMAIQLGQPLRVVNSDPTNHNVNASARKNSTFNENQGPGGQPITVTYEYAEIVPFRCDIHPWMSANVGVFDHPFFSVSGADGSFVIEGLPAGEYTIEALHPENKKIGKKGKVRATVEIRAGEETRLDLTF